MSQNINYFDDNLEFYFGSEVPFLILLLLGLYLKCREIS